MYCNELVKASPSDEKFSPSKSNDYHPLLTDADRSWIINHTQSTIVTTRNPTLSLLADRRRRRLSLQDYLRKNRQIFTLQVIIPSSISLSIPLHPFQYSLNIKENEIEYLEHHLHEQERVLLQAEKHLIEDVGLFDQFLEACNRQANDVALRYILDNLLNQLIIDLSLERKKNHARKTN